MRLVHLHLYAIGSVCTLHVHTGTEDNSVPAAVLDDIFSCALSISTFMPSGVCGHFMCTQARKTTAFRPQCWMIFSHAPCPSPPLCHRECVYTSCAHRHGRQQRSGRSVG